LSESPRYSSLRDYLRILREHRGLIIAVAALAAATALLLSALQEDEYTARSSLVFIGETPDLSLVGTLSAQVDTPAQRAAVGARKVESPGVLRRVRTAARIDLTTTDLEKTIEAVADSQSGEVLITAKARTARLAARLANEAARQTQRVESTESRKRFARAARRLQRRFERLRNPTASTEASYTDSISRLQSLSEVANPVNITTRADVPDAPSSPKPIRNTLLGLFLGLILGLLLAILRHSLDRRLHGAHDIQAELDLPLLGHVRDDALGHTGFAGNGRELNEADLESFRILRMNLDFLNVDAPLRSVVVTSAVPEEGKTTVSTSLAFASAIVGRRTLLVECDLRRPALASRLGVAAAPGLTDYLSGKSAPRDVLQAIEFEDVGGRNGRGGEDDLSPAGNNFVCITAGTSTPHPAELLASERFRGFLKQVTDAYDVVILDSSPLLSVVDTRELLPLVDGVLLCMRSAQTTRDQARAAKAALEHFSNRPAGLVVTGTRSHEEADYGYYYGYSA
jgi:Mrp family chromosome partitioning ATPase/capsular polysaccharide biosynthesis protein